MEKLMTKQIGLMGASFSTGNRGVSALASSVISNVLRINSNICIKLFIGNRDNNDQYCYLGKDSVNVPVVNYRLSPKDLSKNLVILFVLSLLYRLLPLKIIQKSILKNDYLKELNDCSLVLDVIGGDSFSDIYGLKMFLIRSMQVSLVFLLKTKYILLPQTYGPYKSKIAKIIAKIIISKSYKAYSRDRESISLIKTMGINRDVSFCPDVAFTLYYDEVMSQDNTQPVIGINVNGLLYHSDNNRFKLKSTYKILMENLVHELLKIKNCTIVLIPHTIEPQGHFENDIDGCKYIYDTINNDRISIIDNEKLNQSEIKSVISGCDFFIGSRMHSCIAALSQCIPAVGIAYSKKFDGVFKSVNLSDCVAYKLDEEETIKRVITAFHNREKDKQMLLNNVPEIKIQVEKMFKEIERGLC